MNEKDQFILDIALGDDIRQLEFILDHAVDMGDSYYEIVLPRVIKSLKHIQKGEHTNE